MTSAMRADGGESRVNDGLYPAPGSGAYRCAFVSLITNVYDSTC